MDDHAVPAYGVIIERLKTVSGIQSDAGLSRWLGKPDAFIGICRNREGISLDVFIPKLTDGEMVFVLRGRDLPPRQLDVPKVRFSLMALQALDDLDTLARDVEVIPATLRGWTQGKGQPTHRQLALLFNEVSRAAGLLFRAIHGHAEAASSPAPRLPLQGGTKH